MSMKQKPEEINTAAGGGAGVGVHAWVAAGSQPVMPKTRRCAHQILYFLFKKVAHELLQCES